MIVYLMQHGIAKSEHEAAERPLASEGVDQTRAVGEWVAARALVSAVRIYHSGKTRARQTAETLAGVLTLSHMVERAMDMDPNDDPSIWATRVREATEDIMLVGHMPHLSRLASILLANDPNKNLIHFVNSGIVRLCGSKDGFAVDWNITPKLVI